MNTNLLMSAISMAKRFEVNYIVAEKPDGKRIVRPQRSHDRDARPAKVIAIAYPDGELAYVNR